MPLYKHHLLVFLVTFAFLHSESYAQFGEYRRNHDRDPYYFGLSVGYHSSSLITTRSKAFSMQDSITRIEPKGSIGIDFGLLGTVRISPLVEARFAPKLIVSGAKTLEYYYDSVLISKNPAIQSNPEKMKLPSTLVSLPIHLKFNSDRIHNFKMYMFGGLKYDINLSATSDEYKKARQLDLFPPPQFRRGDFGYEMGVGFSFYLPFTVLTPEIKISNTLGNSHVLDKSNPYSNALDKFSTNMIQFSLIFEE